MPIKRLFAGEYRIARIALLARTSCSGLLCRSRQNGSKTHVPCFEPGKKFSGDLPLTNELSQAAVTKPTSINSLRRVLRLITPICARLVLPLAGCLPPLVLCPNVSCHGFFFSLLFFTFGIGCFGAAATGLILWELDYGRPLLPQLADDRLKARLAETPKLYLGGFWFSISLVTLGFFLEIICKSLVWMFPTL